MDRDLLQEAVRVGSATLYEAAGQKGALPSGIKPISRSMRLAGSAFPIATAPGNNLWIHRGLANAAPGDVLVVSTSGHHDAGYWGDVMTVAALSRQIAGLVIDGCVRDSEAIARLGFPVFARGLSILGTKKDRDAPGSLSAPIVLGSTTVHRGDLVVGDADGVVVLDQRTLTEVVAKAREREKGEAEIVERLRKGETTLEIYGWRWR
jgi:4-hydroxy-4-methyl-2-oxoglutarate aldolase